MFGSNFEYWRLMRKKRWVREIDWQLLTSDVNYLFEENDKMWDRLAELSALVDFLLEQKKGTSKAPSGSAKSPTSKRKTAPKTNSKATKKPSGTSGTKKA